MKVFTVTLRFGIKFFVTGSSVEECMYSAINFADELFEKDSRYDCLTDPEGYDIIFMKQNKPLKNYHPIKKPYNHN